MRQERSESELVTLEEARAILGVGRTTLYRIMAEGSLRPIPGNPNKLRQQRYLKRRDLERLIREGRKPMQRRAS